MQILVTYVIGYFLPPQMDSKAVTANAVCAEHAHEYKMISLFCYVRISKYSSRTMKQMSHHNSPYPYLTIYI